MRGAEAEGKIKGPAQARPQSQSARGFGAAPHLLAPVPRASATPYACGLLDVPLATHRDTPRWRLHHGRI